MPPARAPSTETSTIETAVALGDVFISTNSLTKSYGLSGLRCGWILSSPAVAERMRHVRRTMDGAGSIVTARLAALAFSQNRPAVFTRTSDPAREPAARSRVPPLPARTRVGPAGGRHGGLPAHPGRRRLDAIHRTAAGRARDGGRAGTVLRRARAFPSWFRRPDRDARGSGSRQSLPHSTRASGECASDGVLEDSRTPGRCVRPHAAGVMLG